MVECYRVAPPVFSFLLAWHVKRKITFVWFSRYALHYSFAKVGCPQISSENRKSVYTNYTYSIIQEGVDVQCRTYIIIAKRRLQSGRNRVNGERLHRLAWQQGNNNWAGNRFGLFPYFPYTRNFNPGGNSSRMMAIREAVLHFCGFFPTGIFREGFSLYIL